MEERNMWIVLAVVLGSLVAALAVVLVLFSRRRSQRRMRGFSLRAVTPLDDAEFESWRRPSRYTQRPEKYGIRSSEPTDYSASWDRNMLEKDSTRYEDLRTPSSFGSTPQSPPIASIQKPKRVRRKSSGCSSIADRPPTPYSPASTSGEYSRSSFTSRKSSIGSPRAHYPTMSETSAFRFDFHKDADEHDRQPMCPTSPSDRPVKLSYGYGPYYDPV